MAYNNRITYQLLAILISVNATAAVYVQDSTATSLAQDSTTALPYNSNNTSGQTLKDFELEEVSVSGRRASTAKSRVSAFDSQSINAGELCRAACCNLSESFETNASVDVAYSDAATGAKQIRLLGLSGKYVQLLTENTPCIRGLAQGFGMEYIPGPWMESIQISKGTSSVINGYESTTGQINIEYLKPKTQDPLAVNIMADSELHSEVNLSGGWQVRNEEGKADISTSVMAHGQLMPMTMDNNKDGFMDMPTGGNGILLNRWDIFKGKYTGRILLRGLYDQKYGGQGGNNPFMKKANDQNCYDIDLRTWRVDGFMKNGYVIDSEKQMSIGIITALSYHNQTNCYGNQLWDATQTNAYLNAMYQTYIVENHKLTTGVSVNYDNYSENLLLTANGTTDLSRQETTTGIFTEYAYNYDNKLSIVAGIRGDWSSQYGLFFTPRFNVRYSPWEWWVLRASAGMGYRSPNLIADNASVLVSSRKLYLPTEGVKQEKAINTGISTTFYIPINGRELQLSAEYYYTHFLESQILDLDTDSHSAYFIHSNGSRNYAQIWQVEANMEILRGWTVLLAFRQTDVKQTINNKLRQQPLTPTFKGLITTSYITHLRKWQFDITCQFNGGGRMPDPDSSHPLWEKNYSWYPQLMTQITRYWKKCSLYVGAENMTNYKQKNPIIDAQSPFGSDFDASMIYAPITGWKVYAGFRYALK